MNGIEKTQDGMIYCKVYYKKKPNPKDFKPLCDICHGRSACPESAKDMVLACPDTIMSKYEALSKEGEAE